MSDIPLQRVSCVQGDITRQRVDAIVNAANTALRGGGGVDGAIHRAAGPGLLKECIEKHPDGCPTGQARLTGGHDLPASYVIHTVGPVYEGGGRGEAELLADCYRNSLALAAEHGLEALAFPAISTGIYGYPAEEAASVSIGALGEGLAAHQTVRAVKIVLFGEELFSVFEAELSRQRGLL